MMLSDILCEKLKALPESVRELARQRYAETGYRVAERHIRHTLKRFPDLRQLLDDLSQAVHIGVWRSCHSYIDDGRASLSTWLVHGARGSVSHFCYSLNRQRKRRDVQGSITTGTDGEDCLLDCCQREDTGYAEVEVADWLCHAVQWLTPLEMTLVQGRLAGKTIAELSAEIGWHRKSIPQALRRIRAKLERRLWCGSTETCNGCG